MIAAAAASVVVVVPVVSEAHAAVARMNARMMNRREEADDVAVDN